MKFKRSIDQLRKIKKNYIDSPRNYINYYDLVLIPAAIGDSLQLSNILVMLVSPIIWKSYLQLKYSSPRSRNRIFDLQTIFLKIFCISRFTQIVRENTFIYMTDMPVDMFWIGAIIIAQLINKNLSKNIDQIIYVIAIIFVIISIVNFDLYSALNKFTIDRINLYALPKREFIMLLLESQIYRYIIENQVSTRYAQEKHNHRIKYNDYLNYSILKKSITHISIVLLIALITREQRASQCYTLIQPYLSFFRLILFVNGFMHLRFLADESKKTSYRMKILSMIMFICIIFCTKMNLKFLDEKNLSSIFAIIGSIMSIIFIYKIAHRIMHIKNLFIEEL